MFRCVALVLLFVMNGAAASASSKSACQALVSPMNTTSGAFSELYSSLKSIDYNSVGNSFTGKEAAQFDKMAGINERLLPIFEEYLFELETLALMMSRCSR